MTDSLFKQHLAGFTLIELSISLLIIGLLSSGLFAGIVAQRSMAEIQAADQQLDHIREVLLGYALSNGRLPCPAKPQLARTETAAGIEDCSLQHGVLPWITLSIQEADPWGQRFTYFASNRFTGTLISSSNASFTLDTLGNANVLESSGKTIASELPAVIVSHGRNAAGAYNPQGTHLSGATGEENENADADLTFISHTPTPDFDDRLIWINPSVLKSRMVAAGKLP